MSHRYQPFYCEENVWWLLQEPEVAGRPRWALFVSNERGAVPMWEQRIAPPGAPVVWDYHVLAVVDDEAWDLDSRLPLGTPLCTYLDGTFPLGTRAGVASPRFRLVSAEELFRSFASDRSHMLDQRGAYRAPPPEWPAPGHGGSNLPRFVDMTDPVAGERLDLPGLRARFGAP